MFIQPIILQFIPGITSPNQYRFIISQGPRFPPNTMILAPDRMIFRAQTFPEFMHESTGISTLFLYGTDQAKDHNIIYIYSTRYARPYMIYDLIIKSVHWFNNVYANREVEISSPSQGSPVLGGPEGPSGYSSNSSMDIDTGGIVGRVGSFGLTGSIGPDRPQGVRT